MELTDTARQFVVHWGEMGSAWGVNRTVAQIHALLFFHGRPLNAETIAETLGVRHVLEGSVQRAGDRIRITLQLIEHFEEGELYYVLVLEYCPDGDMSTYL